MLFGREFAQLRNNLRSTAATLPPSHLAFDDAQYQQKKKRGQKLKAGVIDGDTVRITPRVLGADAFESEQVIYPKNGDKVIPIGQIAKDNFEKSLTKDTRIDFTGKQTYGRPVAQFFDNGKDLAEESIRRGEALAAPEYLKQYPDVAQRYINAQEEAKRNGLGAWAGDFNTPKDYRDWIKKDAKDFAITIDKDAPNKFVNSFAPSPEPTSPVDGNYLREFEAAANGSASRQEMQAILNKYYPDVTLNDNHWQTIEKARQNQSAINYGNKSNNTQDVPKFRPIKDKRARLFDKEFRLSTDGPTREEILSDLGATPEGEARLRGFFKKNLSNKNLTVDSIRKAYRDAGFDFAPSDETLARNVEQLKKLPKNAKIAPINLHDVIEARQKRINAELKADGILNDPDSKGAQIVNVASGLSLNTNDEITGALQGAIDTIGGNGRTFGENYRFNRDVVREARDQVHEAQPITSLAVELGSSLPIPANAFLKSGRTGSDAIKVGASSGAVAGFGEGEGVSGAALNTLGGALVGGAFGKVGEVVAPKVGQAFNHAKNKITNRFGGKQAPQTLNEVLSPNDGYSVAASRTGFDDVISEPFDQAIKPSPLSDPRTVEELQRQASQLEPKDLLPIPSNRVESAEEAASISADSYPPINGGDEIKTLNTRQLQSASTGNVLPHRGPVDLITYLRTQGGVKNQGGELTASGIDNKSRTLDFGGGDARFGKIINEDGLSLDDAALRAWEEGYFPNHIERPSIDEFIDALDGNFRGERIFKADDAEEVAAFGKAQQQRYDVEQAEAKGIQLHDDVSQPINQNDLISNQAPYDPNSEWPEGATPDLVGNIRVANLETPEDISRALKQVDKTFDFDAQTRGRIRNDELQKLAKFGGFNVDDLLNRQAGQSLSAEQVLKSRQIYAKSHNELVEFARKASQLENIGDETSAEFQRMLVRHAEIEGQIRGITAEAGRTLQSFKVAADSRAIKSDVLKGIIESAGGSQRIKQIADAITDIADKNPDNPAAINQFASNAVKPKFRDKIVELYYNSILSNPQTHAVNAISNTLTGLMQLPEQATASAIGKARAALTGSADRVYGRELLPRAFGIIQGTREGIKNLSKTLRTGEPTDPAQKVEDLAYKSISGLKGEIIRTPTKALAAADEFFKASASRGELSALATREAIKESLEGEAFTKRISELISNPTDEMLEKSLDFARYVTFTTPLTKEGGNLTALGARASEALQDQPWLKPIAPFLRTPINLTKFTLERSPLAPLVTNWRKDIAAGGARRDTALARSTFSSGLAAIFYQAAADGHVTGSAPLDRSKNSSYRASGWQPYSIKIGDSYYSYRRLDPFSSTLASVADYATLQDGMSDKQRDEAGAHLTMQIMKNMTDNPFMGGAEDFVKALDRPNGLGYFVQRRYLSPVVPAGVAQASRVIDPNLRETNSNDNFIQNTGDFLQSKIPIASKGLPVRRDAWGDEITRDGGAAYNAVSPFYKSEIDNDPAKQEVVRLNMGLSNAGRNITLNGNKVELDQAQYDRYSHGSGNLAKRWVNELMQNPDYNELGEERQKSAIRGIVSKARDYMRREGRILGDQAIEDIVSQAPSLDLDYKSPRGQNKFTTTIRVQELDNAKPPIFNDLKSEGIEIDEPASLEFGFTKEAHQDYIKETDSLIAERLEILMDSPEWDEMSPQERKQNTDLTVKASRSELRDKYSSNRQR